MLSTRSADYPEQKEIEKWFGSYNDFPPGWREVDEAEFAKLQLLNSNIDFIERRQMNRPKKHLGHEGGFVAATLFHTGSGRGFALATDYWRSSTKFFVFDCFPKLKEFFNKLPIEEDSGWMAHISSRPNQGYAHYTRTIKLSSGLDGNELAALKRYLERDNCPGWTGVEGRLSADFEYHFSTTHDSAG